MSFQGTFTALYLLSMIFVPHLIDLHSDRPTPKGNSVPLAVYRNGPSFTMALLRRRCGNNDNGSRESSGNNDDSERGAGSNIGSAGCGSNKYALEGEGDGDENNYCGGWHTRT